jgi:3-methyladenine DNA glycosylase/8-oxoguanine DNA glycosylase
VSATPIEVPLRGAGGEPVDLWRTLQSHGFAELPPLAPDEEARTLQATLRVPRGKPRRVTIGAARRGIARIEVRGPAPSPSARAAIAAGVSHILRLDQDLSTFYAIAEDDPDLAWVRTGAGRMLRSPTVWEDVIKTLCTTNCSWSLTTTMVRALVTHLGEPAAGSEREPLANAFPSAAAMAEQDERFYREVVRSGYRAPHFVTLSKLVADGIVDLEALGNSRREDVPDDEVEAELLALPGIGPYATAHIMMTLGRNGKLILDSWTRPKFARLTGRKKIPSDALIARRFRRYGSDAGLAFWLFLTKDWIED